MGNQKRKYLKGSSTDGKHVVAERGVGEEGKEGGRSEGRRGR